MKGYFKGCALFMAGMGTQAILICIIQPPVKHQVVAAIVAFAIACFWMTLARFCPKWLA